MGRRKKHRKPKWWQQESRPEPCVMLVEGNLIQPGDEFMSVGQWYPVHATIGHKWENRLPPMRRGKPVQEEQVMISQRHQEFLDLAEMAGIAIPHQFQQWKRFFLDEKNFLAEAEHWLSMRLQGRYPRIEDDVDKGLMTRGGSAHARGWAVSGWSDNDDYWDAWSNNGYKGFQGWGKTLPLTPKLAAPSGLSGAELVVM